MESSSITDHHPVTREEEPVLETEVSGGMDKTAAVEEEDCPEDEEGAAAEGAALTQGQINLLYLEIKKGFDLVSRAAKGPVRASSLTLKLGACQLALFFSPPRSNTQPGPPWQEIPLVTSRMHSVHSSFAL